MTPTSRLSTRFPNQPREADVLVVGSGYGGGVAASRLARAGKRVYVLERGREFQPGEFPARFPDLRSEMQVTSRLLRSGRRDALYDVRMGADMHVLVACGLGGGSLVNAGVALVPDQRVFADPVWPDQLRQDGLLEEGFARAQAWLRPAADGTAERRAKYQALAGAASGSGVGGRVVAPRLTVTFEDTISAGGVAQSACTRCGDCCGGCNVGAKTTVLATYLADAVRHGAELFTGAAVRHVEKTLNGRWRVAISPVKPDGGLGDPLAWTASTVILSAGTLGTCEILLRSRERGLDLSDRLGERFSANGDIIAFGYGAKVPVQAIGIGHPPKSPDLQPIGAAVTGQLEIDDASCLEHELRVQEGAMPSAMAPMLPALFVPNGRILGALQSLINGVYKGPLASLQTFFAVSHDSASGRFRLEGDQLSLAWPNAAEEPVYARLDALLSRLVTQAGGSYVKNPLAGSVMGHQPATAHPLGGAGMGSDSAGGVVSHKGEVYRRGTGAGDVAVHGGLYVIDGSVIPRSLGVNPLLTITALAERALLHMAADHRLTFDAEPASTGINERA